MRAYGPRSYANSYGRHTAFVGRTPESDWLSLSTVHRAANIDILAPLHDTHRNQ